MCAYSPYKYHNLILECFHHPKENLVPIIVSHSPALLLAPQFLHPQSLAIINLLSVSMDLPILDTSYKF